MAGKNTLAKLGPFKAVIFDLDGVIVDTEPIYEQHLHESLVKLGVKDPQIPQLRTSLKGKNSRDTWRILVKKHGLGHDLDQLINNSQRTRLEYLSSLKELPEIPGAINLIKQLHIQGYPLALATAGNSRRVELFLNTLKLKQCFSAIVNGDDVKKSKPDPEPFLLAATRLGVNPSDCVVIEDAQNGVQAAKSAGMKCVAYAGSDHNTDDLSQADLIIKDFTPLSSSL